MGICWDTDNLSFFGIIYNFMYIVSEQTMRTYMNVGGNENNQTNHK